MRNRDGKALEPLSTEWLREAIREDMRWFKIIVTLSMFNIIMAFTFGVMVGSIH